MVGKKTLLKIINFKEFIWNIKSIDASSVNYKFNPIQIGSLITRVKEPLVVKDEKYYKRITIKTKGQGIVLRNELKGDLITTKKQFYVHAGQFSISKIDARNGAFGIIPYEAENAIITENFWVFNIQENLLMKEYLLLILSSNYFTKKWQTISNGSGNRLYLDNTLFLKTLIPIPPVEEQKIIIQKYQETIAQARQLEKQAEDENNSFDCYIFKTLGIKEIIKKKKSNSILNTSSFFNLYNWDVKHAIKNENPQTLLKSCVYKNIPIKMAFEINPSTQIPKELDEITFLPMECISDIYGSVLEKRTIAANTKGYTKFKDNDVIFAKITPCMQNGKCAVVKDLKHGFGMGSTEFHVFRAISKDVIPEYLHALLRTQMLRKAAMNYFTGSSGQQRVSSEFIENLYIPLPPLTIQKEIIYNIDQIKIQIEKIRKQAQELRKKAKQEFESEIFE